MPMADDEYATWSARWAGGMATDVSARGHTIRVDEPAEFGGDDSGPMPTELLAAALASCMCLSVAWAAGKRRVTLPDLYVDVTPERAPGEPRHGHYEVVVRSSAPSDVLEPVVALGAKYCWVTNTLTTPPTINCRAEGDAGSTSG